MCHGPTRIWMSSAVLHGKDAGNLQRKPMIITQNGEAKAVIQDVTSYEETQETLALLKILALGSQQVERGEITPISEVAGRLRAKATSP
jgi:Antitoxin Phd_YefM, type II toxin-antitoxin system